MSKSRTPWAEGDFRQLQYHFAGHIRDPEHRPAPGDVEERRMGIYRELFYNNIESLLAGNYPVLRAILDDAQWHGLVRDFMVEHRARQPLFTRFGEELLVFLHNRPHPLQSRYPFLLELAHYEAAEARVWLMEVEMPADLDPEGELLQGVPVLNPALELHTYAWPVHRIGPAWLPQEVPAEPSHLLIYRDAGEAVRFMALTPASAGLVQLLQQQPASCGEQILQHLLEAFPADADRERLFGFASQALEDLRRNGVVLGVRPA